MRREGAIAVALGGRDVPVAIEDASAGSKDRADPERLRRAFERGDAARGTQGAGLGLAIVDRIAERHGGSVDIGRSAGAGAAITVRLPLAPASAANEARA